MLSTSVERLEGNMVKLTVTVPASEVDAAISSAYKQVASKLKLPGFRPGKAPRPVVDSAVGREHVLAEATEELVNTTYPRALDAEMLRPIESPELEDISTVVAGEEYTYVAEIEVRPELTLASSESFEIALPSREATSEEVDAQLEASRDRFATLEPVEDRGVEVDDFVLLSFVGTVDGEPYEGNEVDKYLYEMSRGLMPPEFDSGIVGAKPGDERRVEFVIPETSTNEEFVGKTAAFDITVHEIKAKRLPEIDDEFAANMGGFESVEEMTADLKKRLDLQKAAAHDRLKERSVREAVADRLSGDVPKTMIDSRRGTMMRDFFSMLETRGTNISEYLEMTGIEMETVENDIAIQAEQSVREDLALEALFRDKGMEVTDADIDEELDTIAKATDVSGSEARKRWEELGLMPVVQEQIMHRKAIGWLLENVTVKEEADESTAQADEEPASKGTKKAAGKKKAAKDAKADADAEEAAPEPTEE